MLPKHEQIIIYSNETQFLLNLILNHLLLISRTAICPKVATQLVYVHACLYVHIRVSEATAVHISSDIVCT